MVSALAASSARAQQPAEPVELNWLDKTPPGAGYSVSFGVPWPAGKLQKKDLVSIRGADGKSLPIQTWPLAYWPDGSVQWSGHTIAATPGLAGPFKLTVGQQAAPAALTATEDANGIEITTGTLRARIARQGSNLLEGMWMIDKQIAGPAKLIARREDRSQEKDGIVKYEDYVSHIDKVTLEQSGPVRATVKIEGKHAAVKGDRQWLPFVVRLYFTAGVDSVRIVHSFIYDGYPAEDYIKGIGLSFSVPFTEELHNRHTRFVGDDGVWVQPVRMLPGYRNVPADQYALHLAGKRMPNYGSNLPENVASVPVWNDMRLVQLGPDSFSIDKRTQSQSSWLHVNNGKRSLGMALLADVGGGIAVGVKDFWQKYPASIELNNGASDVGEMKIWLWSPDGDAMDLRHYDIQGHALATNYEDWKPGWDSAYGVAHTDDLTLYAFNAIPSNEELLNMAKASAAPPLLVCNPKYYHDLQVFGHWSLPDRSTPTLAWVEDRVNYLFDFFHQQVDERHWYGFWDFGDIMHNYDFGRHEWRYDVGGWAWTNSELAPDMFLYYTFLRTGRPEAFRMAEAMTRHTSEVDVHHIGVFAPLGSRHNVNHWGDGAKQPRISQSGFKRFYYYLTTDERAGDLMHDQLDADLAYDRVRAMDPGHVPQEVVAGNVKEPWTREDLNAWNAANGRGAVRAGRAGGGGAARAGNAPGRGRGGGNDANDESRFTNARFGLDWTCYAINWMTEWERTGDTKWRDRVVGGMRNIVNTSGAGNSFGGGYFDLIFGGAENLAVLERMLPDEKDFWAGWARTCERLAPSSGNNMTAPRMAAYAAYKLKDPALGVRAWEALIGDGMAGQNSGFKPADLIRSPDLLNPTHDPVFLGRSAGWQLHGPASVQWALNALETMELAREYLPQWEAAPRGARGGAARGAGN
jgi:hypothetical protein